MKVERKLVPEYGVTLDGVWVPLQFLEELRDQAPLMSDFGHVLLAPTQDIKRVCEAQGLLTVETRGGVCRGPELEGFMAELEYPKEA